MKAAATSLSMASPAFQAGQPIPKRFTEDGADVSPAVTWSGVPAGVVEFALICDDPDAPRPQPWVHWVIYKIPGATRGLPEGVARTDRPQEVAGALQGQNSWNTVGYRGPAPPRGHGVHHYHFKLYALDTSLALSPGATKEQVLAAVKGHVLAEGELIGTYERR